MIEKIQNFVNRIRNQVSYFDVLDLYPRHEVKLIKNVVSNLLNLNHSSLLNRIQYLIPFSPYISIELTVSSILTEFYSHTGKRFDFFQYQNIDKDSVLNDLFLMHSLIENSLIFSNTPIMNINFKIFIKGELKETIRIDFFKEHFFAQNFSGQIEDFGLKMFFERLTLKRASNSNSDRELLSKNFLNLEVIFSKSLVKFVEDEFDNLFYINDENPVEKIPKNLKKLSKFSLRDFYLYGNFSYERIRSILGNSELSQFAVKEFLEHFKREPL